MIYSIADDLWVSEKGAVVKIGNNTRDHSYMLIKWTPWMETISPYWDETLLIQHGCCDVIRSDCTESGPIMGLANALSAMEAL